MNLREKIADFISGGALSLAKDKERLWRAETYKLMLYEAQAREETHRAYLLQECLNRIAAQEKPTSNATVRRMARMAREAINV